MEKKHECNSQQISACSSTDSSISTSAMENIIDTFKNKHLRNSTMANYYSIWRQFNEFFIKLDRKPDSWEERIILFVGYLIEKKRQSQTIKSYVSAIKLVLQHDGIEFNENKFLLMSLTRASKLVNDKVKTWLPIQKGLLHVLLATTDKYFNEKNQPYLSLLYCNLFLTAYYGLFRVG